MRRSQSLRRKSGRRFRQRTWYGGYLNANQLGRILQPQKLLRIDVALRLWNLHAEGREARVLGFRVQREWRQAQYNQPQQRFRRPHCKLPAPGCDSVTDGMGWMATL